MRIRPRRLLLALAVLVPAALIATPATRAELSEATGIGMPSTETCPPAIPDATGSGGRLPAAATVGQLLIAHDGSGDASILDLATGRATYIAVGLRDPHEAAVSSDGRWGIVTDFGRQVKGQFDGNRAAVIDMAAKRVARIIDLGEARGAHGVAFVPGTHRAVITTQSSQSVVEVDAARGTVVSTIDTRADGSHLLAVAPDGRTAFTVNEGDGTVSRLDLVRRAFAARYPAAPEAAEGIAITADGRELWVGTRGAGTVRILDAARGTVLATLADFPTPDRIAISRDGRRAMISDVRCGIIVVDVATRRRLAAIPDTYAGGMTLAPDGSVAFTAVRRRGIKVVDLETRRVVARHALSERPHGIAWGPRP